MAAMHQGKIEESESAPKTSMSTTRVCFKNLPPSFDENKLKKHLQSSSKDPLILTDCKILKTKDGRSRKIAFVGFKNPEMAQNAVSYFDKSFALTSRLSVSLAFSKKEGPPPTSEYRPWSKHSVGSSKHQKLIEKQQGDPSSGGDGEKLTSNLGNDINNQHEHTESKESEEIRRKKEEFLSAMGISVPSDHQGQGKESVVSKSKFWANDDAIELPGNEATSEKEKDKKGDFGEQDGDESEGGQSNLDSDSSSDDDANKSSDEKRIDKKEISSDLDFLKSKQVKADILTDDDDDDAKQKRDDNSSSSDDSDDSSSSGDESGPEEKEKREKSEAENSMQDATIVDTTNKATDYDNSGTTNQPNITLVDRLFVRNLPFTTTEEELFEEFSQFGHITAVHIPVDDTKRNKGYAFISFESKHDAKRAMDELDGQDFQGRLIHILPAKPSNDQANDADIDTSNMTYKERQALARKKEAEAATKSWSASFLRGDAVVDNLSDRLGVAKGDVLNVKDGISSGNAAVRLALGETHIISENIAFFFFFFVDVKALESSRADKGLNRSKTMILVKNLPYDTSLEDLTKVFHGIGGDVPQRILLPPSKTAALVEYGHATDARRAFRRLAYKKFKHVPLYLEWAPMMSSEKRASPEKESNNSAQEEVKGDFVVKKDLMDVEDPSTEAVETGASQSIYVKNLNFATGEEQLKQAFEKAGFHPRAVRIPKKLAPTKKGSSHNGEGETKQLSMGFGFVEFPSEEEAIKAMKSFQGKLIDGHALEIKLSSKNLTPSDVVPTPSEDKSSTKIMVRNVPFEATRSELLKLFGSFGQLKKVRLPKKFDGGHRGFAFCEFLTRKEAENAMATLSRTHLYGRHLVLEWASKEGDEDGKIDVNVVREKAKRDAIRAGLGGSGGNKKKVKKF
ncbi:hypothetical protein ACHAXS_011465 [Conticribra weissflogii]